MNNKEIAQKVCDKIVEEIEKNGVLPWVKPWNKKPDTVRVVDGYKVVTIYPSAWNRNGVEYKGANTYLPTGEYITFAQCQKEGGKVKKGAHGWPVIYWNFIKKKVTDENGEEKEEKIPVLRYYTVFNVKDCDGIEQKHTKEPRTVKLENVKYIPVENDEEKPLDDTAEAIIAGYLNRAGNGFHLDREAVTDRAFYSPSLDYVNAPCRSQYGKDCGEYYSTIFHELAHSTGHSTRLNRFTGKAANAAFGSVEYSKEELVAEITAASVLNAIDMESANSFRNSAAYVKSWSSKIKSDPLCYVSAATKAQAAFDMLVGIEEGNDNENEGE